MSAITVAGIAATEPRYIETSNGVPIASFRLAEPALTRDPKTGAMHDRGSNWFTVSVFGELAAVVRDQIAKGKRVIVTGDLLIKEWSNKSGRGVSVNIAATHVGIDIAPRSYASREEIAS